MENWIKFNINDYVKVRLTERGREMLKEYWGGKVPDWFEDYSEGNEYYRFQLHEFANIFGKELYNGNSNLPFETEIYFSQEVKNE